MPEPQRAAPSKREIVEAIWEKITFDRVDGDVAHEILEQMRADSSSFAFLVVDDFVGAAVDIGKRKDPAEKIVLMMLKRGDLAAAEDWCKRLLATAKKLRDERAIASYTADLCEIAKLRGQGNRADELGNQAADLFEEQGRHRDAGNICVDLIAIAIERKRTKEGSTYLARALKNFETVGDKDELAGNVMVGSAADFDRAGDAAKSLFEAALKQKDAKAGVHLLRAIDCYQKAGAEQKAARNLVVMGGIALGDGDCELSEKSFERARAYFEAAGDKKRVAGCHVGLAATDLARKNFTSAERRYGQALTIFREINDQEKSGSVFASLGDLAALRGDMDTARDNWGHALVRYTNVGKRESEEGKRLMRLLGSA